MYWPEWWCQMFFHLVHEFEEKFAWFLTHPPNNYACMSSSEHQRSWLIDYPTLDCTYSLLCSYKCHLCFGLKIVNGVGWHFYTGWRRNLWTKVRFMNVVTWWGWYLWTHLFQKGTFVNVTPVIPYLFTEPVMSLWALGESVSSLELSPTDLSSP